MKLLTFYTRHGDCKVTITEQGTKGVESLLLACDEHGTLDTYGPDVYTKYREAKHDAMADGARHLGLDKAPWLLLG